MNGTNFNVESQVAATLSKSLLEVKSVIRQKGYPEEDKRFLCQLFDNIFRAGFADGALCVANQLLRTMQP